MQPLSVVENGGFQDLVKKFDPKYELQSRKVITYQTISTLYKNCKLNIKKLLSEAVAVAVTTDAWTSVANESYLGVTGHFFTSDLRLHSLQLDVIRVEKDETAVSMADMLMECFSDWSIKLKVKHVVTDNAASMKLMAELLDATIPVKHFPCIAHLFNIVVKACITKCTCDELQAAIYKSKDLVTFFHKSPKATRILKKMKIDAHEEGEMLPGKLIQYVDTRWNTLTDMIESVLLNAAYMRLVFSQETYADKIGMLLSTSELDILRDMKELLTPFKKAITDLSGETYVTVSKVIPTVKCLILSLTHKEKGVQNKLITPSGNILFADILKRVNENLNFFEERSTSQIATLLYARFKSKGFQFESNYKAAKEKLQNLVKVHLEKKKVENSSTLTLTKIQKNREPSDSIFEILNEISDEDHSGSSTSTADAIVLVNDYLKRPCIGEKEDPLFYLKNNFPQLLNLGLKYSCCPGTSVPCKRLFSDTGQLISDRRNRLGALNVKYLSFLHRNYIHA